MNTSNWFLIILIVIGIVGGNCILLSIILMKYMKDDVSSDTMDERDLFIRNALNRKHVKDTERYTSSENIEKVTGLRNIY